MRTIDLNVIEQRDEDAAGNSHLRAAAYRMAVVGIQHNPVIAAHYLRKRAAGKSPMKALGHCMRKALSIVWGVWRNGQDFDPNWVPRLDKNLWDLLPEPLPDTDLRLEARAGIDAFVRVLGADYSVPPAFVGRRIAIRVTPTSVRLSSEGAEIAVHTRSFVPADVVLAPVHGRAIRLAREARDRLAAGDIELPEIDLARYDALVGALS